MISLIMGSMIINNDDIYIDDYIDDFIDNGVYDNDEDGDDKLPARHHATIKWLFSDFYSEWSL